MLVLGCLWDHALSLPLSSSRTVKYKHPSGHDCYSTLLPHQKSWNYSSFRECVVYIYRKMVSEIAKFMTERARAKEMASEKSAINCFLFLPESAAHQYTLERELANVKKERTSEQKKLYMPVWVMYNALDKVTRIGSDDNGKATFRLWSLCFNYYFNGFWITIAAPAQHAMHNTLVFVCICVCAGMQCTNVYIYKQHVYKSVT